MVRGPSYIAGLDAVVVAFRGRLFVVHKRSPPWENNTSVVRAVGLLRCAHSHSCLSQVYWTCE